MHPHYNTERYVRFLINHGNWDIYADGEGYCAAIPTAEGLEKGCRASHFGDAGYVRVTLRDQLKAAGVTL